MNVQRVHTERGSRIEPPLDQSWSNLDKLRWQCAVVLHDAGAHPEALTVEEGNLRINGHRVESYDVQRAGHRSSGGGGFHDTWSFLNGIGFGLDLAKGKGVLR